MKTRLHFHSLGCTDHLTVTRVSHAYIFCALFEMNESICFEADLDKVHGWIEVLFLANSKITFVSRLYKRNLELPDLPVLVLYFSCCH